jgi:UDP-N-acetylmuramoyl-L-alanyl-D-glutamate--2,6-diaminopimelate ligase
VTVTELLEEVEVIGRSGSGDAHATGIAYDSRRVRPGDLFFALPGVHSNGLEFVPQAFAAGAAAAVVGATPPRGAAPATGDGLVIEVAEPRRALAQAALAFHRHPARALQVVGVTGTNGKTTTTYLVESIFRAAGVPAGLLGTTGYRIGDETRPAPFTTPEAPELQALLREMVDRGLRGVALELSSHALVQRRTFGLEVDVAVFTNLTHDHLDYHGTLENYLDAKLMLFDGRNAPRTTKRAVAVINADDPHAGRVRAAAHTGGLGVLLYGRNGGSELRIGEIAPRPDGLALTLRHRDVAVPIVLPLLGRYNAWNAAAAFGAATALGLPVEAARAGLERAPGVPGRLERVDAGQRFGVVVDYAHTPDALARSIDAVREHGRGRVLVVFGCGGDRDRAKRPVMGRIAAEHADLGWITNDNPRGEDPERIASEVRAGDARGVLRVELDRAAAIAEALAEARPGDTVLVAGKGHETTQTVGDRVLPFDDRAVARALIRAGRVK